MCLLLTKYIKQLSIFIVVLISILPLISQGSLEKRIKYESLNKNVLIENPINYPWKYEISKRYMYQPSSIGFNREYLPYIYYSIEEDNYLPKYNNSLYNKVRLQINSPSYNYYLKPTALTGDAYIYDYLGVTPNKTFTIDVLSDDTIIQVPIFYYEGYTIKLNGVNVSLEDPKDMDYLLGFKVNKGKYNVQISYDCMKSTKVGHSLFNLALIGLCVFVLYDFWYQDKKKIYRAL